MKMNKIIFKTSGANAVDSGAMESDTIQKNGDSPKTLRSRRNKNFLILTIVFFAFALSSCAVHNGLTANLNNHDTQVVLSKANFKVIESVQGDASGISVFGIGGSFRPLVSEARRNMLTRADIEGTSRAAIYETVEINSKLFLVVAVNTVTVSAYIIEFTE